MSNTLAPRRRRNPARAATAIRRPQQRVRPELEPLEERSLPSVAIVPTNNNGRGYAALDFNQSGGYVPPDTCGAAGLSSYIETVNQTIALYANKSAGAPATLSDLGTFWYSTGGLSQTDSGSELSDPITVYNDQIGRFIVGDQDVDFNTHVSNFDIAVSKTGTPSTLSAADWNFYQINTTESGFDADYPGNFGYNHDAFVFTLNMFGVSGGGHVQIVSVSNADLATNATSPGVFHNDIDDFSVRPTVMHDAVAGDPMWLVAEHGDNQSIDVIQMSNVLSSAAGFVTTNLAVTPYNAVVVPLNPDGTGITDNIDSRILKAAEWNHTLVAAHAVAVSSTKDVIQWYQIDVSSGAPALAAQGRVSAGNNTYLTYPSIDINSSGQIGMTYMKSGTDTSTDFMSMYITGHDVGDAAGTMEAPVLVPAGSGKANYSDFSGTGRAGDLSGINIDPSNGTFWAANEFANTEAGANWGTAVANFTVSNTPPPPPPSTVASLQVQAPATVTAGQPFSVTVTALDQYGKVYSTYTGTVQFSSTDPKASLPGPYTFTAGDNGTHSFNPLTLFSAGQRTVFVTDSVNNVSGSATITVLPTQVVSMAYIQQPLDTHAGAAIYPAVSLGLYDQYGNLVTTDNSDTVSIAIGNNPSNGVLGGTTTVTVYGGVATFSNLTISTAGAGYTLVASGTALPGVSLTSAAFTVIAVYQPPGNVIESFENFSSEKWYTAYSTADPTGANTYFGTAWYAAHDGNYGLDIAGPDWIYRTDAGATVKAGDSISVWVNMSINRGYFGFGASANGTLALVTAPNTNQLMLMYCPNYYTFITLAAVNWYGYQYGGWYRLQVDWGYTGTVTGRLFAGNGTTLLTSVTASVASTGVTSGGIAFRGTGQVNSGTDWWFDTVIDQPGLGGSSVQVNTITAGTTTTTNAYMPPTVPPTVNPNQPSSDLTDMWSAALAAYLAEHQRAQGTAAL